MHYRIKSELCFQPFSAELLLLVTCLIPLGPRFLLWKMGVLTPSTLLKRANVKSSTHIGAGAVFLTLPHPTSSVKQRDSKLYGLRKLSGGVVYSLWCILVPETLPDARWPHLLSRQLKVNSGLWPPLSQMESTHGKAERRAWCLLCTSREEERGPRGEQGKSVSAHSPGHPNTGVRLLARPTFHWATNPRLAACGSIRKMFWRFSSVIILSSSSLNRPFACKRWVHSVNNRVPHQNWRLESLLLVVSTLVTDCGFNSFATPPGQTDCCSYGVLITERRQNAWPS